MHGKYVLDLKPTRDTMKSRCCIRICLYKINFNGTITMKVIYIKIEMNDKKGKMHLKLSKSSSYDAVRKTVSTLKKT